MRRVLTYIYPELYERRNLKKLKDYHYVSDDASLGDLILNPFWEWIARRLPNWLA